MYSGNSVQGYCSQRFCFISDLKIKMEKFLAIGSVISLCVFFSMFVFHLLLLIKVLQCSYDERIVQLLLPPSSYNLSDNATAADQEMISNMTRCRYGTFLEEDKFVMVDFTSDCIINILSYNLEESSVSISFFLSSAQSFPWNTR